MVVSDSVDVFAASDLKHSAIFFRNARNAVKYEAAQAKLAQVRDINERERNQQDATTLEKDQRRKDHVVDTTVDDMQPRGK